MEVVESRQRFQISYWDAAIIAAAKRMGCTAIYRVDHSLPYMHRDVTFTDRRSRSWTCCVIQRAWGTWSCLNFLIGAGDLIALVVPLAYGPLRDDFVRDLVGVQSPFASPERQGCQRRPHIVCVPPGWSASGTVRDELTARGIAIDEADRIAVATGVSATAPWKELAWTDRILLGLRVADALQAELIVFSTSGCDPTGVRKIADTLRKCIRRSAVDVISPSLSDVYGSLGVHNKFVKCVHQTRNE